MAVFYYSTPSAFHIIILYRSVLICSFATFLSFIKVSFTILFGNAAYNFIVSMVF